MEMILQDTSVFTTYNASAHSVKSDWSPFKTLLLKDLANHQIDDNFTFEWKADNGEKSTWNQTMIFFTVKHWKFAKAASAFENFGLDQDNPNDLVQVGIMTRWVIGRIEEIKRRFRDPSKVEQRTRSKKRRDLWKYRKATLQQHLPQFLDLLPDADCCSDTEDDPHRPIQKSICPAWRSVKYGNWLHEVDRLSYQDQSTIKLRIHPARRLDTRRQEGHTVNPFGTVCANLPENCYESAFLKHYDPLEKLALGISPSSAKLDDALTAIATLLPN
ncbi:uncharacterized protein MELLADRAFT_96390 [Melampsora larici-populina 98AG31]|uniref:Uncharacterized protein n=1 Tax=Melampsora larici-populina (strain 98AG31 / pathotype 3-4-7) TaxID=747676 RepID=F4REL5_MELLP|nr:uncharacterized protein MELLADRAFT_96390 [Melampsora larici-populina 98AG31]EGG09119.1 hypothetical protein MELLADRAFT_96390 [Melampsora larici-populina 98AG31]